MEAEGAAEVAGSAAETAAQAIPNAESALAEINASVEAVSASTDQEELDVAYNLAYDALNVILAVGGDVSALASAAEGAAAQAQASARATEAEVRAEQERLSHALAETQSAYQAQQALREVVSRRAVEYLAYSPREWRTAEDLSNTDYDVPVIRMGGERPCLRGCYACAGCLGSRLC